MNPKILFLNPPTTSKYGITRTFGAIGSNKIDYSWLPLELLIPSGYMKKEGFDNDIIDANAERMSMDKLIEHLKDKSYDIVIISIGLTTLKEDLENITRLKESFPNITTIAISSFIQVYYEYMLKESKGLDIAIYSEPEEILLNIVKSFPNWKQCKGIAYLDNNVVIKTDPEQLVFNINKFGIPAHDKIKPELYYNAIGENRPSALIMAQRGCINKCIFCCQPAFFAPYRYRQTDTIIEELKWLKKLGYKEYMFNDSEINANIKWSLELFNKVIKEKIGMTFTVLMRAKPITEELIKTLKEAGCKAISIGVESTDPEIIKAIKKNITLEEIKETVALCKKYEIDVLLFIIFGLIGETKETMEKTLRDMIEINPDYATFGIAVPTPGTEFHKYINENNYWISPEIKNNWKRYDPMLPPMFNYPNLSSEEIYKFSRYALKKFYTSPKHLWLQISKIKNLHDLMKFIKNGNEFVKRYLI